MNLSKQQKPEQHPEILEMLLENAQKAAKISYWQFNPSLNHLKFSGALFETFRTKNQENISFEEFRRHIHPDDRQMTEKAYANAVKSKKPYEIIYRLNVDENTEKYVKERCVFSFNQSGILLYSLGVVQDISYERRYQNQITAEKEFTDAAINTMPGIFCLFSKKGRLLKWNNNLEEITGLTNQQIELRSPLDFVAGEDKHKLAQSMKIAFRKGEVTFEVRFIDKNKRPIPYLFNGKRIRRNNEWLILGVGIDISKRKSAENEREKVMTDLHERIKEITCLYQINDLFRGKTNDLEGLLQQAVNFIPPGWMHPEETSAEIKFDDISVKSVGFKKSPHFIVEKIASDGEDRGYIKVYSGKKATNEHYFLKEEKSLLRQIALSLAWLIRKLEFENALQEKNNLLQESNKTMNLLLSILSHDLRGPVNSIVSLLDVVADTPDEIDKATLETYIKTIHTSATNTRNLMENLLDWARSQSGKYKTEPAPINADALIVQNTEPLQQMAVAKNIEITADVPKDLHIYADKKMVGTVVRNLLTNAIKFTPRNGHIKISANKKDNEAVFVVKDSGIGIDNDTLKTLFTADKKISSRGTENEPGSGFGLVLCKEFVEKNNGNISIKSNVGSGTVVTFTLPHHK